MNDISNLLVTPLHLPKFEPDSWDIFWKIWQRDAKPYFRKYPDARGNRSSIPSWKGFVWKFTHELTMFNVINFDYSNDFPILKKKILENFPFTIRNILFQQNIVRINSHKDGAITTDHLTYPASVRIILHDTNTRPTFYYIKENSHSQIYMHMPSDTNTFVFNNPKINHGADYSGKFKILMHFTIDNIDEIRWFNMLKNSYERYKDYCIINH